MASTVETQTTLHYLKDLWDESVAAGLDEARAAALSLEPARLRPAHHQLCRRQYQLKGVETDPLTGEPVRSALGEGVRRRPGEHEAQRASRRSIMEKLLALEHSYKGVEFEDDMADMYPLCTFRNNPVAASIDTPLHGFLPFPHVDHLHPDWGIALAASANGKTKMEEFNREFGQSLVWMPWQRPGFELGPDDDAGGAKRIPAATASCSAATAFSPGARLSASAT